MGIIWLILYHNTADGKSAEQIGRVESGINAYKINRHKTIKVDTAAYIIYMLYSSRHETLWSPCGRGRGEGMIGVLEV